MSNHTDLSIVPVSVAPSPATTGTTVGVTDANAAYLPNVYPWQGVFKPTGVAPTRSNSEIVKVTAGVSSAGTTTYTIVRIQGTPATTAHSVIVGDDFYEAHTADTQTIVDLPPTDLKLSTASKGGVFNGGFELGTVDTPVTASGWIGDEKYGWYFYEEGNQASAEFDSAVSHSGKASLKISTLDATGQGRVFSTPVGDANRFSKYATPVKANTLYRLSCWVKTYNVAANAAYIALNILNSAFAYTQPDNNSSKLSGTNDWTFLTVNLTTGATAAVAEYLCANKVAGNTGDAWFDDIKLEEVVTDTTFTGKTGEKVRPVLTAVTSTDNIDQSLDTGGAYANTYALTTAINEGATHIQTFTPTKKYTTQVGVWVIAKGTGNWTLVVHTAGNVVVASATIANASLTNGAFNYFDVPNLWVSGALHFHLYSSVADGTCKANTAGEVVDQQDTTGGGNGYFAYPGRTSEGQSFTAGVTGLLTKVDVQMKLAAGDPSGNITCEIWSASGDSPSALLSVMDTTIATSTLTGSYATYTFTEAIGTAAFVVSGTKYVLVLKSTSSSGTNYIHVNVGTDNYASGDGGHGTAGTSWVSDGGDLYFKVYVSPGDLETASYIQRYAKKSETYSLIVNGIKTEMKADKDGLLTGSIIDLDNGKYTYANPFSSASNFNDIFSATAGGGSTVPNVINGWDWTNTAESISSVSGATAQSIVFKINTLLPIKHLKISTILFNNNVAAGQVAVSADNVTYTDLKAQLVASASAQTNIPETDLMNGLSTFYLKIYKSTENTVLRIDDLKIYADLDTSKLPTGLFYPIGTNQFTETVTLPSVASRVYLRANKYTNEYGVIMPAWEFTDASAVAIGYVSWKLENSQETNPAGKILSSSTNFQQSGTGSNEGADVILNADEYLTFTSAVASIKLDYQVGKGTTAFTNITKNTIYYSSNGEGNDSTQDPSHQMSIDLGIRQQGVLQRISDIGEEIQKVRDGVLKTTSWTDWTPTLTWTTGTPEGSVVTKARYKILDGVCYFAFYYSATDANGATALTISLPVLPKDNDSLTALQSQELADTTWSDPIAYIDDGGTTVVFRSFATIADTKAVKVLVSGSYEI